MKAIPEIFTTRRRILALNAALFLALPHAVTAQVTGGRGNLASASEKGAERLMNLNSPRSTATMPDTKGGSHWMNCCPDCKDVWVRVTEGSFKGGRATTLHAQSQHLVAQHLCPGCRTKQVAVGQGKNMKIHSVRSCSQCDAEHVTCKPAHDQPTGTSKLENG